MADFDTLAEGQQPRTYRAGQMIYLQGTYPQYFYYLSSGAVRSFISTQSGEERVLTIHRPGDLMGEASFFDECPRVTSAMALTDSQVIAVDRPQLSLIFSRHPDLAMPMLQYLARTVRMLSDHVDSATLPANQRIARYLLSLPGKEGAPLSCTHESIGQSVGVSRVTVSRVLGEFSAHGLVKLGYRSVTILRRDGLEALTYGPV
jgi:CRP/FNR family transcriptional regulator